MTARFVWIYVGFCIIGNVFSFWVALETGTEIIPEGVDADYIPHTHFPRLGPCKQVAHSLLTIIVMVCLFGNLQLLWIFPFMFKSQSLFEPNQVVQDIITHGLNTVIESINLESTGRNTQHQVFLARFRLFTFTGIAEKNYQIYRFSNGGN